MLHLDFWASIGQGFIMSGKSPSKLQRADRLLVERGLFATRSAAQAAIEAGRVFADGMKVTRTAQMLAEGAVINAEAAHPYVSRGGVKLAHALDVFGLDVAGRVCLDLGASTGGFTDCLLLRGAAHVVAVDVGQGQLHEKIRNDVRTSVFEKTDARKLTAARLGELPSLIVCDVSFISLDKMLAVPLSLAAPGADLVALFKPQFEVGRDYVGKGGIVTDLLAVERAAHAFSEWLAGQGWPVRQWTDSPVKGGDGNRERLVWARRE
jgi:23S rRNA (cytidine1920-2'-O)/16S rRNA (cytidine1409-2'-O)-methyltransferase